MFLCKGELVMQKQAVFELHEHKHVCELVSIILIPFASFACVDEELYLCDGLFIFCKGWAFKYKYTFGIFSIN